MQQDTRTRKWPASLMRAEAAWSPATPTCVTARKPVHAPWCLVKSAIFASSAPKRTYHCAMPRQNTSPADFPPAILAQIEQLAQSIVAQRKSRGETQAQWASKLGISQPTMARIERGDPAVAMATYVSCLWQLNPALDLGQLLPAQVSQAPVKNASITIAASAISTKARDPKDSKLQKEVSSKTAAIEQQAQIERNFAAAKAALDFFKSPLF